MSGFRKNQIAVAVATALSAAVCVAPAGANATDRGGTYVTGDFHNHTTCSDGSISMQKLVKKATDKVDTPWGLDWFVQAGHGNSGGTRNCTLVEDASLSTPAYPFVSGQGPTTTWSNSVGAANIKGDGGGVAGNGNMWRWQSIQEYQYPLIEYLSAYKNQPLFIGMESVVAGHEHTSMSVITGQMPVSLDTATLPASAGYTALGNATALAQWSYCFDRGDTDKSRGNVTGSLSYLTPTGRQRSTGQLSPRRRCWISRRNCLAWRRRSRSRRASPVCRPRLSPRSRCRPLGRRSPYPAELWRTFSTPRARRAFPRESRCPSEPCCGWCWAPAM